MARGRIRRNRRVLVWWILAATFASQLGFVGVSAQAFESTPSIAFSETRFVIDPQRISTLAPCPASKPNAIGFLCNPSGRGTYVVRGRTLILTFADGATAVLGLRRTPPLD